MIDIYKRRKELGLTLEEIAKACGVGRSTVKKWETGFIENMKRDKIASLAKVLSVSPLEIMGINDIETTEDYTEFPIICNVAAGFNKYGLPFADEFASRVQIPNNYLKGRNMNDFFVMKVNGNSMYPMFYDGDIVLILKQETLNYSGEIGVCSYDGDKITLKKIEYQKGEAWLNLVPINPNYETERIENEDLEKCRIIGVPKLLIREFD